MNEELFLDENKRIEDLEQNEMRFYSIVQTATDAIICFDEDSKIVFWNKSAEKLFGYSSEEALSRQKNLIISETGRVENSEVFIKVKSSGIFTIDKPIEMIGLKKNGTAFPAEISIAQWKIKEKLFFTGIIRDISERKKYEQEIIEMKDIVQKALQESQLKYQELFHRANDAVYLFEMQDGEPKFIEVNDSMCRKLGYTREELISLDIGNISLESREIDAKEKFSELFGQDVITFEWVHVTKTGQEIDVEINAHTFLLNDKRVCLCIARDISDRKRTLKLAYLGELATSIAHEIKNPLAILKGYTELINNEEVSFEEKVKLLKQFDKTVERLDKVVKNILTFAKPHKPQLEKVDINNIIEDVIDFISPILCNKQTTILTDLDEKLPLSFIDTDTMYQVIYNLVTNGIDATEELGEIIIKSWHDGDHGKNVISITDNGCGIKEEAITKIFEPFFTTKKYGTGLGLAIVSFLLKEMGGTLGVKSNIGVGTNFEIQIPIK